MVCLTQWRLAPLSLLFQPIEAVAVALAVDDVHLAVVDHVVADDGESGVAQVPVGVPLPLSLSASICRNQPVGVRMSALPSPSTSATPMPWPSCCAAAHVMHLGLGAGEVDPQNAGVVVVGEDQVGLAVAVDVGHPAALGVVAVGDEVALPHRRPALPGFSYHQMPLVIQPAVTTSGQPSWLTSTVHSPQSETNSLVDADLAVLVALPLAAVGAGILIPVGAAEDVEVAVAVHVEGGDAFGVVGAELMDEEGGLGNAEGAVAGVGEARGLHSLGESGDGASQGQGSDGKP